MQVQTGGKLPALDGSALTGLPGGVSDHGALTGLADDDHAQYHTDARGDARYAPIAKGVTNGDAHDHIGGDGTQITYASLSGLPTLGSAAAAATGDFEAAGAVSTHNAVTTAHGISAWGATLVDDADANTARSTLGLGTAATTASTAYATSTQGANADSHASNTSNPHAVSKTQVGLGSVDNTSDASKPVSTAQQTALNLKANLASPTFTGTVVGITAAMVGAPSGSGNSTGTNTGDETTTTVGALLNSATSKTTPVDADHIGLMDSAASNIWKKLSWANLKTALESIFLRLSGTSQTVTGTVNFSGTLKAVSPTGGVNNLINIENPTVQTFFGVAGGGTAFGLGSVTNHGILFFTNYLEKMRLSASGGLSLGSFTDPGAGNLYVNGSAGFGTSSISAKIHAISTTEQLRLGYDATNYLKITVDNLSAASISTPATGQAMLVTNTGNIGVKNTLSVGFLTVSLTPITAQAGVYSAPAPGGSTPGTGTAVRYQSISGNVALDMGVNGATGCWMQVTNKSDLALFYPLLLNPNGGNVAIGGSTASARLHVTSTTEQLRCGYDASNYLGSTTNSAGVTTFNLVGTAPAAKWAVSDATTNAIYDVATFSKNSTGAGAAGLGARIVLAAKSSTTVDTPQASISSEWVNATHATRTSRLKLSANDYGGARDGIIIESDGAVPRIGFYGATAVVKPTALTATVSAAPAGGTGTADGGWDTSINRDLAIATINNLKTRVDQLETKLQALGLLT